MAIKRKTILIKKSFQIRIMARFFITMSLIVLVLSCALYFTNKHAIGGTREVIKAFLNKYVVTSNTVGESEISEAGLIWHAKDMTVNIDEALDGLDKNLYKTFLAGLLITFGVVMTVFLMFSHRIAGPIYRIEQTLQSIRQGDLSVRINLRDKDELKELAEYFNDMTVNLNDKMNQINQVSISMKSLIEKGDLTGAQKDQMKDYLVELENQIKQFKIAYN